MFFTLGQEAYYVNPPLCKWPWRGYGRHFLPRYLLDIYIPLAFVTFLDEVFCFFLHHQLEITCFGDLWYLRPCPWMISTHTFMNLLWDILYFVLLDAPKVGEGEPPFVKYVVQDNEFGSSLLDLPLLFKIRGNCPCLRLDLMGVVQPMLPFIENVWNSFMLGNFCTSSISPRVFFFFSFDFWWHMSCHFVQF